MPLHFYSLIPSLNNEVGHFFAYAKAVEEAAQKNGWISTTLLPKSSRVSPLPERWHKSLPVDYSKGKGAIFSTFFRNFFFFLQLFRKHPESSSIFFIEQYTLPFLAAISFAAIWVRPKGQFWHLLRFPLSQMKGGGIFHRFLHSVLERGFGCSRVCLMTDSELIQQEVKEKFRKEISLVPIPHTKLKRGKLQEGEEWLCWWPGAPRGEKGEAAIQKIAEKLPLYPKATLIVSEGLRAKGSFSSEKIRFVPLMLSREEYEGYLRESHFIFLPYDPKVYIARTSGILVEAVIAGKIPLTTEGSWMAYELKKFGLQELLFNWDDPDSVLKSLPRLAHSSDLRKKLEEMRYFYETFHSPEQFAKEFQQLAQRETR